MRNKYIVTITDLHGSRQYAIHKIIKKVLLSLFVLIILITVSTFFYIRYMHNKIDHYKAQRQALFQKIDTLKKDTDRYKEENNRLLQKIKEHNEKLSSLKKYLKEVEAILGIGPESNKDLEARVAQAKAQKERQVEQIKAEISHNAELEKISAIQKALLLNNIPNGKPTNYRRISSPFGYRIHPVTHKRSFHAGLDLPADFGTPVRAPASGVVMYAGHKGAYGNFLLLSHAYGFKTAYGHLSRYAVRSGDFVNKGDIIAYVGSTGRSTGPHLHYEVRYLTKWLDPKKFISWDTSHPTSIVSKVPQVRWNSIISQTKKLIRMATEGRSSASTPSN